MEEQNSPKLQEKDIHEFLQKELGEECMETEHFQELWSVFQDAWKEMAKRTRATDRAQYQEYFGGLETEDFGIINELQLSLERGLLARFLKKLEEKKLTGEEGDNEVRGKVDEFRQKLILTMREDFAQMFLDYYKANPGKKIMLNFVIKSSEKLGKEFKGMCFRNFKKNATEVVPMLLEVHRSMFEENDASDVFSKFEVAKTPTEDSCKSHLKTFLENWAKGDQKSFNDLRKVEAEDGQKVGWSILRRFVIGKKWESSEEFVSYFKEIVELDESILETCYQKMVHSQRNLSKYKWDKKFQKTYLFPELERIIKETAKKKDISLSEEDLLFLAEYLSAFEVTTRGAQLKKFSKTDGAVTALWEKADSAQRKKIATLFSEVRMSLFLELEDEEDPNGMPVLLQSFAVEFFDKKMKEWTQANWRNSSERVCNTSRVTSFCKDTIGESAKQLMPVLLQKYKKFLERSFGKEKSEEFCNAYKYEGNNKERRAVKINEEKEIARMDKVNSGERCKVLIRILKEKTKRRQYWTLSDLVDEGVSHSEALFRQFGHISLKKNRDKAIEEFIGKRWVNEFGIALNYLVFSDKERVTKVKRQEKKQEKITQRVEERIGTAKKEDKKNPFLETIFFTPHEKINGTNGGNGNGKKQFDPETERHLIEMKELAEKAIARNKSIQAKQLLSLQRTEEIVKDQLAKKEVKLNEKGTLWPF